MYHYVVINCSNMASSDLERHLCEYGMQGFHVISVKDGRIIMERKVKE